VICKFIRGTPGALYDLGVGPKTEWSKLAARYPQMAVCGCEPDPRQFAALEPRFPGRLLPVAIAEREGPATLHLPTGDRKCCSLLPIGYADSQVEVTCWTLDKFDREMNAPDRILLWADIEGSELTALRSGIRLLASGRVRWINLEERRPGAKTTAGWARPDEIRALLESFNYVRVADYNRHPTHQDVIYVHREERCSASSQ
jgi:FkbM family methyltransferase